MLSRRRWKRQEETLHCYVIHMQAIAKQSDIDESEDVDFIIGGIGENITNAHLLMGARNVQELKGIIKRYQQKYLNLPSHAEGSNKIAALPKTNTGSDKIAGKSAVLCYNCSQKGHIKPNCPYPLRTNGSCFRCWRMGHDYRSYPNPRKVLTAVATKAERQVAALMEDDADYNYDVVGAHNLPN